MGCGGGAARRGVGAASPKRCAARRRRGAASSRLVADQSTGRAARIQKRCARATVSAESTRRRPAVALRASRSKKTAAPEAG